MGMFDILHKINYQRGLVDKDTILDLMSQVEKFPEEEYGDYGEVLGRTDYCIYTEIADVVINADVVDAIPKDQYEARLKSDMVAMLTEIQLEIEENIKIEYNELDEIQGAIRAGRVMENGDCSRIIQKKIDKLRGEESV